MRYFLRRGVYFFTLWLAVVAATFALFHVVPTDPARTILGANVDEQQVAMLRHTLGLDQPASAQFSRYLKRVASLEFGRSYIDARPVGAEVRKKLGLTAVLAGLSVAILVVYLSMVVVFEGLGRWRHLSEAFDFLCVALPTLFSGVVVALVAVAYYPYTRFSGSLASLEDWLFLFPPAAVLALYPMGVLGRIAKGQMRAVAQAGYVQAARACGLSQATILRSYLVRNSLVPLLAAFGNQLPLLLTSTFIVEIVFSVPGIGALLLNSVLQRDLPMLEGIVITTSLLTISVALLLEVLYPLADPRIGEANVV